ncbi:MAG: hypothetical protein ACRDVK_09960 [Acidimicrobiia bacterium]
MPNAPVRHRIPTGVGLDETTKSRPQGAENDGLLVALALLGAVFGWVLAVIAALVAAVVLIVS